MKNKINTMQELKDTMREVREYAEILKKDPGNDKITQALYNYQVWSLKQAEKTLATIENMLKRNKKQR